MRKALSEFYRVFIRPVDPGLFITKYAARSIAACAVAFAAAYFSGVGGQYLPWCVYGSAMVVLFRTGSTFALRKLVAITLCGLVSILVPFSTFIGTFTGYSDVYLFILTFLVFFAPVLGVPAATVGTGTLIVNLIALSMPDVFTVGLFRSAFILYGASISYLVLFHILPMRPEQILPKASAVALTDIGYYFRAVAGFSGSVKDMNELEVIHDRSVVSLRRYRQFMEAMDVDPVKELGNYEGPGALYGLLLRMLEAVVGLANSKKFAAHSTAFSGLREKFASLVVKSSVAFDVLAADLSLGKSESEVDFSRLNSGIAELERDLLNLGAYKRDEALRDEFLEAWGALYGLKNLVLEFEEMSRFCKNRRAR